MRLGYIVSRDRYLKRDELGVIFQLCVEPGVQRKLVGAALVRAAFDRSAYGCRLYCCWCAQDLEANHFWESMGFVPIAFRAGSTGKRRVHIFWQKRVVEGDTETRWWYPCQTSSGAIREDRLVFPIPPGVHWKDVEPIEPRRLGGTEANRVALSDLANLSKSEKQALVKQSRKSLSASASQCPRGKTPLGPPPGKAAILVGGRIKYVDRPGYVPPIEPPKKRTRPPREKAKADPKLLGAARELRDRYLEHINIPGNDPLPQMKYDVCRQIEHRMPAAPAQHPAPALPSPVAA